MTADAQHHAKSNQRSYSAATVNLQNSRSEL